MVQSRGGGKLLVNACGRTVHLEMQSARSMLDLQNALQSSLQMEAQAFDFFDVHGQTILSDTQLHEAVTQGNTPIYASLTDASIHFIENRREELAQMQWKLVRDQMTACNGKMAALARQTDDTGKHLEEFKLECKSLIERVQKEAIRAVESERDVTSSEVRQVSERVAAVAQLLSAERQKREMGFQGIEKQLAGARDMVDGERESRRQDFASHLTVIQEVKALLDTEKKEREALKDKHMFDIHTVMEKNQANHNHVKELIQNHANETANVTETWHNNFQGHSRNVTRVRSDLDNACQELKMRCLQTEERCTALENRLSDLAGRQTATVDRLVERHERVSNVVENLRLEEKQNKDQVQAAITRMRDLQSTLSESEGATRDLIMQERQGRDDQMRLTQMALQATAKRQISELEEKLGQRLERESAEREKSVTDIYEEVQKKTPTLTTPSRVISASKPITEGSLEVMPAVVMERSQPGRYSTPTPVGRGVSAATVQSPQGSYIGPVGSVVPIGSSPTLSAQGSFQAPIGSMSMQSVQSASRGASMTLAPMQPTVTQTLSPIPAGTRSLVTSARSGVSASLPTFTYTVQQR